MPISPILARIKVGGPFRVGMSCGFCHIGPSPVRPPADPANPAWENLSSIVGVQYMWVDRLFIHKAQADDFMYQLVRTYCPGAMDTSVCPLPIITYSRTLTSTATTCRACDCAGSGAKRSQ